jgi:DSF synthase
MEIYDDLLQRRLNHLKVNYDSPTRSVWVEFKYGGPPCFTTKLLEEIWTVQRSIRQTVQLGYQNNSDDRILFQIVASTDKKVFNLGGDLAYFVELVESGNREDLRSYGKRCIDIQYASITHYDIPFTTITLVEGEALGGGFEAALSANVMIAEQRARFGFPEITFGMFPGMGALSLLIRKITPSMARRLILDHRVYTATDLYEMGVVDVLAPDGQGRTAVKDYIYQHISHAPGQYGFQAAIDRANPLSHNELLDIVDLWVEASMNLSEKNLRLMAYFSRAQSRRHISPDSIKGITDFYSA